MRRHVLLTAASLGLTLPRLVAQGDPGASLWRVASQTLAVPPALVSGGAGVLWNPAQPIAGTAAAAVDAIQGAQDVGATGFVASGRARTGPLGSLALVYGRMEIRDLVRTSTSPAPEAGALTFHTQLIGANWAREIGPAALGVTAARHSTRLDQVEAARWTVDVGAAVPPGQRLRLAGATHFFSRVAGDDPAQDVYAAIEVVAWSGQPWHDAPASSLRLRYGTAMAHGFGADHYLGGGFAFGALLAVDLLATYEGGYAAGGWQPTAAVAVSVGKYRVEAAANPGAAGLGPAFRVGLEARFP